MNIKVIFKKPILFLSVISPYIIILASGILAFRRILFSTGPAIEMHDISILFYPTYAFVKQSLLSGQIPFWDPHFVFGQPLLFNFGLGLLYFPFLIFLCSSSGTALLPRHMELFIISCHILSGITMYWGMRKIGLKRIGACLGGIVFMLFIANRETYIIPPMSFGLPWVPLAVFYFFACLSGNNNEGSWKNPRDGFILILSYFMLIGATHPHLLAYTYFQTFYIAGFFIIYKIFRKNFKVAFNCIKKSLFYPVLPILLSAFIILPILHYMPYTTRWIPVESHRNMGPLYKSHFASIIFPIITWRFSSPYAFLGLLTILFALGYCLLVKKENKKKYDLFWVFLAIFWVLFSIQDSPIYKPILRYVPFMQSMRFTYRGMIFYTISVSLLAGRFIDFLYYKKEKLRFNLSLFLIFPIFLIFMFIFSSKPFFELIRDYPLEIDYRIWILLGSLILFILLTIIHNKLRSITFKKIIILVIPAWLAFELISTCDLKIYQSSFPDFFPYNAEWDKYEEKYGSIYNNIGLHRIEKYNESLTIPYHFNTYSVHGYLSQATHPRNYYYLWQKHGGWFGYQYHRFWDLAYLPLYSPIYDLMGVKYFIIGEGTEAYPLSREERGRGEWIEGNLSKEETVSKIKLYNTKADYHRRMTKGQLYLNNTLVLTFNLPMESGWYEFSFAPAEIDNFKLIIDEVKFQRWDGSDGVMIGELEFYNEKDQKVDIDTQSLNTSSTFIMSSNNNLVDGDPEMPWESGCRMALKEAMETDTVEEQERYIFENKNVLPRAFIVRNYEIFSNIDNLAKELHKKGFNPSKTLLLLQEPKEQIKIGFDNTNDKIQITDYLLNKVEITADIEQPGYLILSDTYIPGWRVYVNGQQKELLEAYGYFRAVALGKGKNKVTFRYFPPMFLCGIIISCLTLVVLAFIYLINIRRKVKYA